MFLKSNPNQNPNPNTHQTSPGFLHPRFRHTKVLEHEGVEYTSAFFGSPDIFFKRSPDNRSWGPAVFSRKQRGFPPPRGGSAPSIFGDYSEIPKKIVLPGGGMARAQRLNSFKGKLQSPKKKVHREENRHNQVPVQNHENDQPKSFVPTNSPAHGAIGKIVSNWTVF